MSTAVKMLSLKFIYVNIHIVSFINVNVYCVLLWALGPTALLV